MSNLHNFQHKTFDTFDSTIPGTHYAAVTARAYANHPHGWLVFFGNYGCGKTHLAAAIANHAFDVGWDTIFTNVPDLLDYLRSAFAPNSAIGYDERFSAIREIPLLILDDLGTENTTPWAREKLYQLINHRYNTRAPTVITSNQDPEKIDGRILSRITDHEFCEGIMIKADDFRSLPLEQRKGRWHRFSEPGIAGPPASAHTLFRRTERS